MTYLKVSSPGHPVPLWDWVMDFLITTTISNAVVVALLGIFVWAVDRGFRRPALSHLFAVLVLTKVLTPPLVPIEIPWPNLLTSVIGNHSLSTTWFSGFGAALQPAIATAILAIWLLGSAVVLARALWELRRFHHRHVAPSLPASREQLAEYEQLAAFLGIASPPALRLIEGRTSPMLWACGPWTRILFPCELLATLSESARQSLLAHELIHYQRADHWIRLLELACDVAFWWHPTVGSMRRIINRTAEECCDADVIAALGEPRTYADAILTTLDFRAGQPFPAIQPSGGTLACATSVTGGESDVRQVRQRLTQIMRQTVAARLSPLTRIAILSLGGFAVVVHPQFERPPEPLGWSRPSVTIQDVRQPTVNSTFAHKARSAV